MAVILTTTVFDRWFERLRDRKAAARVQARVDRAEAGNLGDKGSQAKDIEAAKVLAKQV